MKFKLLYFCSDYQIGLTQAQTEQIEHLVKEPSIELLCISSQNEQEPGLHQRLKDCKANVAIIPDLDTHKNFTKIAATIVDIIKTNQITHVNVQNNWQLAILSFIKLTTKLKFKLIYTIHGYRHNNTLKSIVAIALISTALLLFADRVISMSDYVSKRFRLLSYKTDRVFYMMNKPEYCKTTNEIKPTPLSMVFPAQFRHGKRQEILIKALKIYIDNTGDTSAILHLPGAGPTLNKMKSLAQKLDISQNVKFYGKLSLNEVISLYERSNIALCSSNVETYGRCIAEPFMLGRCVITQKTGVAGDIIRHGENGFFFSDSKELATILEMLHNDPAKLTAIANQAFKDREIFSPKSVMSTYIQSLTHA